MLSVGWTWQAVGYLSDSELRIKNNSGKMENASAVLEDSMYLQKMLEI